MYNRSRVIIKGQIIIIIIINWIFQKHIYRHIIDKF